MNILVDTHTLLWLLKDSPKLSNKANGVLDEAEKISIPLIVLFELMYLLKKRKEQEELPLILIRIQNDPQYSIISLDSTNLVTVFNEFLSLEMHDAIIVATAKVLNLPLVTKDETIQKIYKNTIW